MAAAWCAPSPRSAGSGAGAGRDRPTTSTSPPPEGDREQWGRCVSRGSTTSPASPATRRGTSTSTRGSSAFASSRSRSTRTIRPSTTSSIPTSAGAPAATSPSSSTRARCPDAPAGPGIQGAGTVHQAAWACPPDEHEDWGERVLMAGAHPTPVIDRFYFKSVYFREPSGVLFEIATLGPGFTVDEPLEHLGEKLSLPPAFEHLREQVEPVLTQLPNPRERVAR